MSQKNFAITPSVSISRSKFHRPSQHKTSFNLGEIIPIYVDEILPGDTVSMDLASLVRMSTPIAPVMDNIHIDYYAMYCPNRLVMNDWKQFMGENTSGFGAAAAVTFPVVDISVNNDAGEGVTQGSIGDYMGLPKDLSVSTFVSCLPARAYALIYNEWFRDQNLIAPLYISKDNSEGCYINEDEEDAGYDVCPFIAAKDSDYFTRALPYAQKGAPVSLPLGQTATVKAMGQGSDISKNLTDIQGSALVLGTVESGNNKVIGNFSEADDSTDLRLYADLSNATAATINQLRFAFQYQKFLEKDALYGSRYWEILKGHFGITAPDSSLQRPELLGHWRQHINIDQVLSTAGYSASSSTTVGAPGANSVTGGKSSLFTKSFVEHGILMILAVARHDQTYGQGINRMWSRTKRTDFYFPVFANLGAQEIKLKEIFANHADAETVFGYQEAWAEYRYKPSIVTGILNPALQNSLGFWTLANKFDSKPTLSKSFIQQDRNALSRALVTGSDGPDFIADFFFDATYVRPMPMYSIPGLIDHH